MATKKTAASAPDDSEAKTTKPKRKAAPRKKKLTGGPDLSALPNAAAAADIDAVAKPVSADDLHHHHIAPMPEDQEIMRDIKPREFHRDAAFLVPEKFGFDLKPEKPTHKRESKFVKKVSTVLAAVIVLLFLVLIGLTVYSNRMVKNQQSNVATTDNSQSQPTSDNFTIGLANIPANIKAPLSNIIKSNLKDGFTLSDNTAQLPDAKTDMLFVKQAGMPQTNQLMDLLAQNGIKPEITQVNDLPTDVVLFMTPIVSNPDLSGLTAAVYNGTSVTGLAKQQCDVLLKYKVTSCNALNATAKQKVTTINFKSYKAFFVLSRTQEFQAAQYSEADKTQVEDIRVTLGK